MDQQDIQLYVSYPSWRSWPTQRLLSRKGYSFEVVDTTEDVELRGWLAHFAGQESMPYLFVDRRPVGGFGEVRALERSGALERLVRGEVQTSHEFPRTPIFHAVE